MRCFVDGGCRRSTAEARCFFKKFGRWSALPVVQQVVSGLSAYLMYSGRTTLSALLPTTSRYHLHHPVTAYQSRWQGYTCLLCFIRYRHKPVRFIVGSMKAPPVSSNRREGRRISGTRRCAEIPVHPGSGRRTDVPCGRCRPGNWKSSSRTPEQNNDKGPRRGQAHGSLL
jgi:hypothetical protein